MPSSNNCYDISETFIPIGPSNMMMHSVQIHLTRQKDSLMTYLQRTRRNTQTSNVKDAGGAQKFHAWFVCKQSVVLFHLTDKFDISFQDTFVFVHQNDTSNASNKINCILHFGPNLYSCFKIDKRRKSLDHIKSWSRFDNTSAE